MAVIAPWNFPDRDRRRHDGGRPRDRQRRLPEAAEQSPACALEVVNALGRAGLPVGALSLLPAEGDVGTALVAHPDVQTIAFTGSGAVGQEIIREASAPIAGRNHLKRVVVEMGGKNCILVDDDADLNEVVPAVLASAFGFAGQKCSAASRVLVHERVADVLSHRLRDALDTLLVGQAETFGVDVPPVIEASARERVERVVATAVA